MVEGATREGGAPPLDAWAKLDGEAHQKRGRSCEPTRLKAAKKAPNVSGQALVLLRMWALGGMEEVPLCVRRVAMRDEPVQTRMFSGIGRGHFLRVALLASCPLISE